jgi:HEAT repeat protein
VDEVEKLIEQLKEGKINAAKALGKIGDERAVEPLGQIFADDEGGHGDYMRSIAAMALGKICTEQAVGYLMWELFDSDSSEDVRYWAAEALGKARVKNRNSEAILFEVCINDKNERVRKSALKSLLEIKRKELLTVFGLEDERVRKPAAKSLEEIKRKDSEEQ